jgi:endonuclease YncB( thermonuclease family)
MRLLAMAILVTVALFAFTLAALQKSTLREIAPATRLEKEKPVVETVRRDIRDVTAPQMTQIPMPENGTILRLPAKPAPPARKRTVRPEPFTNPEISSVGGFRSGGKTFRLHGIVSLPPNAACGLSAGGTWPCGAFARTALQRLVRQRTLLCTNPGGDPIDRATITDGSELRCVVSGHDLSAWLVENGWAVPSAGSDPGLDAALKTARGERRGQWGDGPSY